MSMDTNNDSQAVKLVFRGKSGILANFKSLADGSIKKSLIRTDQDSDRLKALIKDYDSFNDRTKALGILNRPVSVQKYQKLLYKQIKIAVIRQGFVSRVTLARFKFNPVELIEKITYRNLIEKFVIDNLLGENYEIIRAATIEEAKKGKDIDINAISDEFYDINFELKQYAGSGEFTQAEESAGWLTWTEIKNKDKSAIYKKKARIENLCYYVTFNPMNPGLKVIDRNKLLSLSTSDLERIIRFYCKIMNAHNIKLIEAKRKSDKSLKTNSKYIHKKSTSADEKREWIKDLKAEGKTQVEIAKKIGCSERTVRAYWK